MQGGERVMLVGLVVCLAGFVIIVVNVWSVLTAHLTAAQWVQLLLALLSAILVVVGLYMKAGRRAFGWREAFAVTYVVMFNWMTSLSILGKILGH
jgi:hypothetical protein